MNFKELPFWWDTVQMPAGDLAEPLPARVDVAVIGAGYTGLSAARVLARRGARVAVLEAETIGWGASSRNGGMVLAGLKLGIAELRRKYGREVTARMYAASLASIDCVEQVVGEEKIDCDFSRCGHLEVACKPAHYKRFEEWAELIVRDFGRQVTLIPHEKLSAEIGSGIYHGGLVDESSAGINPARYVAGLAQAARRAGACLYDHTRVQSIARDHSQEPPSFCVETNRGILWARDVFVATGGYTGAATPYLHQRIVPIGSYIVATEALPESLASELSPRNRMIFDSKNFLYYYRLTPDRRMLFGGRAAFFPETPNTIRESAEILRRGMVSVYPQLRDVPIAYAWGGTLDFAFDIVPHCGQNDGLHYAMGYAGHGVAMATYLGAKMAGVICGDTDDTPFSRIPFPTAPLRLYNGEPWFLPLASLWYRLLDLVS